MDGDPARRIVRYRFSERLVHTFEAIAYVYLLLTGLAFWTPALYWIAIALGGGYLSRVLHPWAGIVFVILVGWMYVAWRHDMRITPEDRAWRRALRHYATNEDARVPPAWRFNDGQKGFFRVMVAASVALLLSGLGLWWVDLVPWELRWLRFAAVLVHAIAALVTIGGFILHVYMGLLVVPGGLRAIVQGDVTEEWARAHHLLWYRSLRQSDDLDTE